MLSYMSVVALGALLISMIYPAVVLRAEGMSAAARTTYRKYVSSDTVGHVSWYYAMSIITAPVIGIPSTYLILYLLGRMN